jgi:uncharacterized membrane protein
MLHLLATLVLLGSGTIAGVLFAVAISTVPALAAMPADRYLDVYPLLGKNWDPLMPLTVLGTVALDISLAILAPGSAPRSLLACAAGGLAAVSVVSHLCNVPINKRVRTVDPLAIPADWQDPRPLWRRWHLLRTGLAMVALVLNAVAVTVLF